MSFPSYPKYKDSGINWLGRLPEHWEAKSIKHIVSTPITDGPHETPDFPDEGVPFVSAEAGANGTIDFTKIRGFISPSDHQRYSVKYRPQVDDIYMVKSGATTGVTAIVETGVDFNIWSPLAAIRCGESALPRFVLNFLRSRNFLEGVTLNWSFGTQQNIGMRVIENLPISLPPVAEQKAIAEFLDRETSKIDELVDEQQRLIELLKEKRQSVISHAVTKGLNPHAPLKSSGIEWLGDVPKHWEVKNLRHFADVLRGKFTHRPRNDPAFYDGGFPFVQTGDITGSSRYITGFKQTLNERGIAVSKQFPKGTLVMAIAANIGDVAILDFPAYFPDSIVVLVPKSGTELMFLYYLMIGMKQPMLMTATVSTQMNLNVDQICSLTAACPSTEEQLNIVRHLDEEFQKLDGLTTEAQRAIDLLHERRTALISAAVTGKIDVRGLAEVEAA